jgi:hypothetical protein
LVDVWIVSMGRCKVLASQQQHLLVEATNNGNLGLTALFVVSSFDFFALLTFSFSRLVAGRVFRLNLLRGSRYI